MPYHCDEHRGSPGYESHATVRYSASHPGVYQIQDRRIKARPRRRTIDDYDNMGMQNMSPVDVQQTHLWVEATSGGEDRWRLRSHQLNRDGDSVLWSLV